MRTGVRAGIGYRRAHRSAILDAASAPAAERPDCLEIIPSHFFSDPSALAPLADAYPLVFHEVGLSIGTETDGGAWPTAIDRATLERVKGLVRLARPLLVTDHLASTRSAGGIDLGHLCPLWYTEATLARVAERVRAWQAILEAPVALENIAAPFVVPDADMTEPEFFHRLVDATGCGVLLDLTNLAVNAENQGFDAASRLKEYPLESVVEVHLAGGLHEGGWYVDSHSEPVDETSLRLLEALAARGAPLVAIVVERDDKLPSVGELVAEARHARRVWERA